jgi:acyl-CoA hydrolase
MTEQVFIIRTQYINGFGRLFGGVLMQWMDELAGIVARRHCGMCVTTAAVDNLNFKSGAYLNDMVVLIGKLTYVGKTSMEVRVDAYIEGDDGKRRSINHAYIVMVAIDENGCPVRVSGVEIETEKEKKEWDGGEKRYQLRKQRRIEGY